MGMGKSCRRHDIPSSVVIPILILVECVSIWVRDVQVLVEGPNPRDPLQAVGRTRHNKVVFFPSVVPPKLLKGRLVTMRVDQVRAFTLYGHLVGTQGADADLAAPAAAMQLAAR